MRLFYFNLHNGVGYVPDSEGLRYPDLAAARAQAILSIRSILADEIKASGIADLRGRIEIVDDEGSVTIVRFVDAVQVRQGY